MERQLFLVRLFKGSNPFIPKKLKMLNAPSEQFEIISLISFQIFNFDFFITCQKIKNNLK